MSNMGTIILWASLFALCLSETEEIWYDSMNDFAAHWSSTGGVTQISGNESLCISSASCVQISGTVDENDWIIRQTALSLLGNFNSYTSFLLKYDVILDNIESPNNCIISYKYDIENDYTPIRSHVGGSGKQFLGQTGSIPIKLGAQVLFIKMETDGL